MDAPVYRHADTQATLLGLNFPGDFFAVVVLGYLWLVVLPPGGFLLAAASTHAADRPPQPREAAPALGALARLPSPASPLRGPPERRRPEPRAAMPGGGVPRRA